MDSHEEWLASKCKQAQGASSLFWNFSQNLSSSRGWDTCELGFLASGLLTLASAALPLIPAEQVAHLVLKRRFLGIPEERRDFFPSRARLVP